MRILIVEDDTINRLFLGEAARPYGECESAADGDQGLAAFRTAHEQGRPFDIVFMDLMLPDMSGHQVVELMRAHEERLGIPEHERVRVIVTSALDDPKNVGRAFFRGGAVSFLGKPLSEERIAEELTRFAPPPRLRPEQA